MVSIHTTIQDAIYDILCDYNRFPIGNRYDIKGIYKIVIPILQRNSCFVTLTQEDIKHNIRQVIQTRSNSIRNTNYCQYKSKGLIKRDIASVIYKINGKKHSNIYIFGCLL